MFEKSENFGEPADPVFRGLESRLKIKPPLGHENWRKHDFRDKWSSGSGGTGTGSPLAGQTPQTVRMLSGLRS